MNQKYHRRWYVYLFWVLFLPAGFVLAILGGLANIEAASLGFAGLAIGMFFFGVWALVGYYYDAKVSDETGYRPLWWAWALGHVVLSPLLVAPIYLLRRTSKTGLPPRVRGMIGR